MSDLPSCSTITEHAYLDTICVTLNMYDFGLICYIDSYRSSLRNFPVGLKFVCKVFQLTCFKIKVLFEINDFILVNIHRIINFIKYKSVKRSQSLFLANYVWTANYKNRFRFQEQFLTDISAHLII